MRRPSYIVTGRVGGQRSSTPALGRGAGPIALVVLASVLGAVPMSPVRGSFSQDAQRQEARRSGLGGPAVRVEPAVVEAGDLTPGDSVQRTVTLMNTSDEPVMIRRIAHTCACAAPAVQPGDTIEPGASIEMVIDISAYEEQFGPIAHQIAVFMEGVSIPVQIPVTANINRGIRATIDYDPPGQYRMGTITLEAIDGRAFRIESVNFAAPEYRDGFEPMDDAPRARYEIALDFSELAPEAIPASLLIVTDSPRSPVMSLRTVNLDYEPPRVRRAFIAQASPVLMHAMPAGESTEVRIALRGVSLGADAGDLLDWFEASSEHADVTLLGVSGEPELSLATLRVGVRPRAEHRGLVSVDVWATIDGHTEHIVLHGRAFAPGAIDVPAGDAAGGASGG
ncbi:MAG: DUF1573 domain-containing protein [Phycisphaerales bacterium]